MLGFNFELVTVSVMGLLMSACVCDAAISSKTDAMIYLQKYGYLDKRENLISYSKEQQKKAIESFQKMAGVKLTGLLDKKTMGMMNMPRCGVADRAKEYRAVAQWPKKSFTYAITKYPRNDLSQQQVNSEIARAFQVWSDHTDLTFRVFDPTRDDRVDFDIRFEVGDHGDGVGSSFDGPSEVLAHAYFPTEGRTHFDDDETWSVSSQYGINFFQVAAHEIGHALGLDHSEVYTALMAPFYMGYEPNFKLDTDDVRGIQALYGMKGPTESPVLPQLPTCGFSSFDTIFTDLEGVIYIIKGSQYWQSGSIDIPRDTRTKWPGLPDYIDAVFSHRQIGKTYFFSGANVWRYRGNTLEAGYPRRIKERFPGIPNYVDAVFEWFGDQIYFFKGNQFWRFNYTASPQVESFYPRMISEWWPGVPITPDTAFSMGGRMYFAKGGSYVQFDVTTNTVTERGEIAQLFGCQQGPVSPPAIPLRKAPRKIRPKGK